ncbi:MAG TPA: undecaprenyl-phosphate glucose phosphotransferase [Bacteroidia bacterium]|nr:undecaprenyl-phosphate glucose phosphotransferase [Bacteroidia bacterium]
MAIGYSKYLNAIYAIGDIIILNFSFAAISFINENFHFKVDNVFLVQFLYINFFWAITVFIFKINEIDRVIRYEEVLSNLLRTVVLHCLLLISFNYLFSSYVLRMRDFSSKYLLFVVLLITWRSAMLLIISFFRKRGMNYRRVIIVGGGQLTDDMRSFFLSYPEFGYRLQGIFQDGPNELLNGAVLGNVAEAKDFARANYTDEIYCSLSGMKNEQVSELIKFCDQNLIRFKLIPDFRGMMNRKVKIDFYEKVPVISLRREPLESFVNRVTKNLFDLFFSLSVILLVFPWLFPAIALAIKLSSKGPVFFKQKRSGKNNEEFSCLKFRTMRVNNEADERQATKNDKRITGIGKILRQTNLDELPQFFNVLFGQMSVVGPRPHMLRHTQQYSKMFDTFMVRHLIKPGITGWAQVHGFRGATEDSKKMGKRVEYDVWYIENWSLLLDFKIILLTVYNMMRGEENAS